MNFAAIAAEFFTYESRLSSFQTSQPLGKRRASSASSKAPKSIKWPHKFLSAQELAKAGFFYHPVPANPDNVVCFLCHKAMDGWEEGDDPLSEHLKHSPDCGWAIVATIETQGGSLSREYPLSTEMIEARRATFADRWPHDNKKGWKCKSKQLVEAGWKYTPIEEDDDMATCAYCSLALDGWEPGDKPMDEHHKRSPDCAFFALISEHKQTPKKTKSKRVSKASRLSTQSSMTQAEDLSAIELPAEVDDSILTTATTATQGGRRMTKAKPKTAAKGRKTRTKKDEPTQTEDAPEPEDADFEVKVEPAPKPPKGRKRKSEEVQAATVDEVEAEAPPPKRRATRTRASVAANESLLTDVLPEAPKPKGRKGRTSKVKKVSTVSVAPVDVETLDDDEIDRALEADLERQVSDDDRPAPVPVKKASRNSKVVQNDHAMFGLKDEPVNDAEIEAELVAMEAEPKTIPKAKGAKGKTARKPSAKQQAAAAKKAAAEEAARITAEKEAERAVEEAASQQILADLEQSISINHSSPMVQPKKQRAGPKLSSRQPAKTTRGSVVPPAERKTTMPGAFMNDHGEESGNETDGSLASQSTVVRGGTNRRGSTLKRTKATKPSLNGATQNAIQAAPEPMRSRNAAASREGVLSEDISMAEDFYTPAPEIPLASIEPVEEIEMIDPEFDEPEFESTPAKSPKRPQIQQTLTAMVENMEGRASSSKLQKAVAKSPEQPVRAPTPPPRELTASQSPQSSDAENHPPSSRPSLSNKKTHTPLAAHVLHASTPRAATTRIPLADTTRTPILSPSKRNNTISGLQSSAPWTAVDLDTLFRNSPGVDENGLESALSKAKKGELSSPEKKMTVEEWILYNAGLAEDRLKQECERMVGVFEEQGGRAMRALEGIEVLE